MGVVEDQHSPRVSDDLTGMMVSHCLIQRVLGVGGMATVYLARQEHLDREVAIKVLPAMYAADQAFVDRFKLEAKAMAQLMHPNIVIVHDTGAQDGRLYIVMEYVAGGSLADRIGHALPLHEITRVIREMAGALAYAHSKGIVHRDIKPANVLMDPAGRAVLSDFGIAKILATSATLTRVGAGVGTPEYMSPEQCRGVAVDSRCDIYALGIMLYEMLTGRTPFEADSYTALAHAHVYDPVPQPSQFNPRISPAVESVVLKALEKDPSERFQQATELSAALDLAVAAQRPVPPGQRERRLSGPISMPHPTLENTVRNAPASGGPSAYVLCPRCRQRNAAGQNYCTTCGLPRVPPRVPLPSAQPAPASGGRATGGPRGLSKGTGRWIACPHCHAPNRPADRYCTTCGRALGEEPLSGQPAAAVCPACGLRSTPGQHYCTRCGQPLG